MYEIKQLTAVNIFFKRIVFIVLMGIIFNPANGQVKIGFQTGLNLVNIDYGLALDTIIPDQVNKAAYYGGFVFRYQADSLKAGFLTLGAGVNIEFNYSQKGMREELDTINNSRNELTFHYLELPIMTNFYARIGKNRIILNLGPYVAYSLSASERATRNGIVTTNDFDFSPNNISRWDYGVIFAAGLNREFKWGVIEADFRYYYGFGNYIKSNIPDTTFESRQTGLGIGIRYFYILKK